MPVFHEEHHSAQPLPARDPYAAFRHRGYGLYSIGNFVSVIGRQMLTVAVQYEIYQRTGSPTALGLTGLAGALPVIFLALPAGQVADRFNRRGVIMVTQLLGLLTSVGLAVLSFHAAEVPATSLLTAASHGLHTLALWCGEKAPHVFGPEIPLALGLLLVNGIARTFGWAARAPFIANLVPRTLLSNAITWNSSLFEIGCIGGPALSGLLIGQYGYPLVYGLDAACALIFILFLLPVRAPQAAPTAVGHPLRDLFSGLRFVWSTKAILATITLDLFAVLLGGATALLPIFARDILQVGPTGYGWLRAAQSFGAVGMAFTLAHLPPMRHAGWTMLLAVAGFGAATTVFGLSNSFWLSLVALALVGAFDNVSVVVRHTLVQLLTPDSMRGRVAAVNNVFIGSSNELGAFESGLTAAYFGPVISVVAGGIGTILVVIATAWKWPEVLRIGPLAAPGEGELPPGEGGSDMEER